MARYREVNYTIAMETEWKVAYGPKGYAFAIKRDDNSDVCVLHNGLTPQDKALATLISATPDMLEALRQADLVLRQYTAEDPFAYTVQKKVHAAIAKATGANDA